MRNPLQLASLTALIPLLAACAITPDPQAASVLVELAGERAAAGDRERAISYYEAAAEADPCNVTTRYAIAKCYLSEHEYTIADEQFDKIIELHEERGGQRDRSGSSAETDFAAACSYLITGRVIGADKLLRESIGLHPGDVPLLQAGAMALFRLKRFGPAAELLLRARDIAAGRNRSDGFAPSDDSEGDVENDTNFPNAVPPQFLMRVGHQLFRERFEEGSSDTPQDAPVAKAAADMAMERFPNWGFAYTAGASVLDPVLDATAIRELHRRALELSPWDSDVVRSARLFFVRQGEYAAAIDAWRRMVPVTMLRSPENLFRDRVIQLESATAAAEAVKDAGTLPALAGAYDAMGWTREALTVARRFEASHPHDADARILRERLEAHADFVNRLRAYARQAYLGLLEGRALPDVGEIMKFAEEAGTKSGAIRFDADEEMESFLFAGAEAFPAGHPESRLAKYFLSHGQIFSVTQGWGPPMINLMNVLYWKPDERAAPGEGEERFKYTLVVGDEVRIWSYIEFLAGGPRIAGMTDIGAAGFIIDIEALRPRHGDELYPSRSAVQPRATGGSIQAQASEALIGRFLEETCGDSKDEQERFEKVLQARIDRVAAHEFGHVVDIRRHLPLLAHLPANLGIAISSRLSPGRIRARGEMVAEAMSLTLADAPHLVVQDDIQWAGNERDVPYWYMLVRPRESVEADSPYREAAKALLGGILDRAGASLRAAGLLQAGTAIILQVDKLSAGGLRAIGAAIWAAGG